MSRMTETNLGWHQVGSPRCVDQRRRTICHQMKSACAVRGASHCRLISFLDVPSAECAQYTGKTQKDIKL